VRVAILLLGEVRGTRACFASMSGRSGDCLGTGLLAAIAIGVAFSPFSESANDTINRTSLRVAVPRLFKARASRTA